MDQNVVNQFRVLEQRLSKDFPNVRKEAEALANSITNPRTANADAIWARAWNKPLYANTKVSIGVNMVQKLAPYMDGAWRRWGQDTVCFKKTGKGIATTSFEATTQRAQDVRKNTGIAMHRLFAIQGAAGALRIRAAQSETPYADLIDVDPAMMVPIVKSEMGTGWGDITVLHFLTDLGLACKPDLHLVRTVRHLGMSLDLKNQQVPRLTDAITINSRVRRLVEELDGSFSPARLRYVDKILMEISKQGLIPNG